MIAAPDPIDEFPGCAVCGGPAPGACVKAAIRADLAHVIGAAAAAARAVIEERR